ncbi:MAG: RluA family pseudouridine synthase [Candidatus Peribacteraceae bacterium]|nr:RluA family pseudouridine synthase [Candidatus Peribacteraceae bacterium]MDD5739720.1 RluA family pseudouridine synthase [Candidatus Peribacteraceae bacterium]
MPTFPVPERHRLDVFLAEAASTSRVKAGALVRGGSVLLNGRVVLKPAHLVHPGDTVEVTGSGERASESHVTPVDLKLAILYEDEACLVIQKPAGIAMHPAPGIAKDEPTILNGIAHLFLKQRGKLPALPFAASSVLVHRLDRDTTGCVLIAKTPQAHTALQKQFKDRTIRKTYLAVVAGIPKEHEAHIDAPIGRHVSQRTKMSVMGATHSRSAQTTYHVLSAKNGAALLACDLHTGRTHQIRVHVSAIGHPVLGDETYASPQSARLAEEKHIDSLCLHAWKLTFRSPGSKKQTTVVAPLTPLFKKTLRTMSLTLPTKEE